MFARHCSPSKSTLSLNHLNHLNHLNNLSLNQVVPVPIYGGWREVDTPQDLRRANNSMHYLNNQVGEQALVKSMGAALLRSDYSAQRYAVWSAVWNEA